MFLCANESRRIPIFVHSANTRITHASPFGTSMCYLKMTLSLNNLTVELVSNVALYHHTFLRLHMCFILHLANDFLKCLYFARNLKNFDTSFKIMIFSEMHVDTRRCGIH